MKMLRMVDNGQMFCQGLHVFECPCESDKGFTDEEIGGVCEGYMKAQQVHIKSTLSNLTIFHKKF